MLKIMTLGGLSIYQDDQPVKGFITRKVEALLVYLACEPREHRREWLGDFLWDDLSQERTMGNLRTVLSNLNQQLGDYLLTTRQTVAFNTRSPHWIDVMQLEPSIQQAEQYRKHYGRLSRSAAAQLTEALNLYHGDFLAGFHTKDCHGFESWKALQQERYRNRVIEALQWLVEYEMANRQYSTAIQHARRVLEIDPLIEEAHCVLIELYSLADQRAAALAQYEKCVALFDEELGIEPEDETQALYHRILDGTLAAPPQPKPEHNLPVPATPFVKRNTEMEQIRAHLADPECRLLTLVGLGGIGKTRLALQAARECLEDFRNGVYFINLAGVSSPEYLDHTIAHALKLSLQGTPDPLQELLAYLKEKQVLIILDNFEHLIEDAEILDRYLAQAPEVKLLVTSREKLYLYGEWALYIEGLPVPHKIDDQLEGNPAVQLFVQAARRAKSTFTLKGNEQAVVHICRLVEGMPLAIELAAAWVSLMSCEDIAAKIKEDLDLLSASLKNIPERHRSIRQLFESSWKLLTPEQQACLSQLTVFRNTFDLAAAVQVSHASLPILQALVEKSLVKVAAPDRYTMHELLKHYAHERLQEANLAESASQKHAEYFAVLTEKWENAHNVNIDPFETAYDDIRAAMEWAHCNRNASLFLRFGNNLMTYWTRNGYLSEGRYWLKQGLSLPEREADEKVRAQALSNAGALAWQQGDFDVAERFLMTALPIHEKYQQNEPIIEAHNYLGHLMLNRGQYQESQAHYEKILEIACANNDENVMSLALGNLGQVMSEIAALDEALDYMTEALEINRRLGNRQRVAVLLSNLGNVALQIPDYARAKACYEESLGVAHELKHRLLTTICQINLGEVLHRLGNFEEAHRSYMDGLAVLLEFGDKLSIMGTLESIAYLLIDQGKMREALQLLGAMQANRQALEAPLPPREINRQQEYVAKAKAGIDFTAFESAWERGCMLSLEAATDLVMQDHVPAPTP